MKIVDTNIIAYAYDKTEDDKRKKCLSLLNRIFSGKETGIVTNQILGELFYTLTKNFKVPLNNIKAQKIVNSLIKSNNWEKLNYNYKNIQGAISFAIEYNMHFWDALIAATMLENDVYTIYTENTSDFKKIPGLKVINPLAQ